MVITGTKSCVGETFSGVKSNQSFFLLVAYNTFRLSQPLCPSSVRLLEAVSDDSFFFFLLLTLPKI